MATYTAPPRHLVAFPERPKSRSKVIPRVHNRLGALACLTGLALALLSLFLPWLTTGGTSPGHLTAIEVTETIDVRSVAPILVLGLLSVTFLVTLTALTRLGVLALAAAGVSLVVLAAHVLFVMVLQSSAGAAVPTLSGLPADATVTYGAYVAGLGFLLTFAGSAWAVLTAEERA